jgi:hypothetical protein
MARPLFAYLLLTHKEPRQVEALTARLLELSPDCEVVVHHDLDAREMPWDGQPPSRVHLVERTRVLWGDWSIVEATLRMITFATDRLGADWFVVLSGEHWPVVDLARWEEDLGTSGFDAVIPSSRLPRRLHFGRTDLDGNRFLARCIHRWVAVTRPRSALVHRALAGVSKVSCLTHPILKLEFSLRSDAWFIGLPRSRGPVKGWALYKGSQWIAFNDRAARLVLHVETPVIMWFEQSHIPDESFVHTVLQRVPGISIHNQLVTYVPPEPDTPTEGWMRLKIDDLPTVWASGAAFARKVDPARHPDVIASINDHLRRQRARGPVLG